MAHKDWCGFACGECTNPCELDEEIPCSPDCENLLPDGRRDSKRCREADCDAICAE